MIKFISEDDLLEIKNNRSLLYSNVITSKKQTLEEAFHKLALWAGRITECRNSGMTVKAWCKEKGVCEQTYYRWQKRIFEMAQAQHEVQFAEVTPVQTVRSGNAAVTVHIAGAKADIHSGADVSTVETVLRVLKSC